MTTSWFRVSFQGIATGILLVASTTSGQFLRMPQPGDVFRDHPRINSENTLKDYRVTDPNASFPTAAQFLPNSVLPITVPDLTGATRAELVIDCWGGHPGTNPKQFRFNNNAWITVSNLATTPVGVHPSCYMHQVNFVMDVPIAHLVPGVNNLEGTSGGQVCLNFGWGQWGWYQVNLRVYYSASKPHATGSIVSPAAGGVFDDNPTITTSTSGASQVDFFAYFDGYDPDGDGRYADWQVAYHRPAGVGGWTMTENVGSTFGPHNIVWDTTWVPNQSAGSVRLIAHVRDANGFVFVTPEVSGLSFVRSVGSVKIYRAQNVPDTFWVRDNQIKGCTFNIPAGDNLATATAARLLIKSWNGRQDETTTKVNSWITPQYGNDHTYLFDKIDMPTSALVNGNNNFTITSTDSVHHGTELMWPGPAIIVRYSSGGAGGGAPQILTQPASTVVAPPSPASFTVSAVGAAPLSYQWRRNGVAIGGATSSGYVLNPTSASDNGAGFSVVVSNGSGSVTSQVATLTISDGSNWWNTQWHFRAPLTVNVGPYPRTDKPVNVALNFTTLLAPLGGGTMNDTSIRVIETAANGTILDGAVPFQFDRDPAYNASSNAKGTLVFLMTGNTAANVTRFYHVYFDTAAGFSPASVATQVTLTDNIVDEGQSSFRIVTPNGTYFYHKQGGGFSSFLDPNGNDWINYHVGGGSAGEFRGIPNMGDIAHPGYVNMTSAILNQGPIKATFQSQTAGGAWKLIWEVYPGYATMTLQQAGGTYWLLYEGTPGGTFEPATDTYTRSSGETVPAQQVVVGDIPAPEWVYFGDANISRILYLAHHEDDSASDQNWQLENNMTVFGFGREYPCCTRFLSAAPAHLTIGFGASSASASTTINAAFRDLTTSSGPAEPLPTGGGGAGTINVTIVGTGTVAKSPDQLTYTLGQMVQLTATPTGGAVFTGWTGGGLSGNANPISLSVTGNHAVTATFATSLIPQIVTPPANTAALAPNAASFSVVASGAAPLAYQWRRGGVPIGSATASSYALTPTAIGDNGAQFDVIVSNAQGSVTSVVAVLTIVDPSILPTGGLGLWLRADAGTVLNGATVSHWNDQSGNNRHATQATATRQPLLQSSVVNGLPVLRFDGANDAMNFTFPVNGLSGVTMFVVSANTQNQAPGPSQAERSVLFWNETASWGTLHVSPFPGSVTTRFGTGQAGNLMSYTRPSSIGGAFSLTTSEKNGATDMLFVNGAMVLSQNGKLTALANCQDTGHVGQGYNDDTFFGGDIAEILVYTQALSTAQRQLVDQVLAAKYSLPLQFPPSIITPPANQIVQEPMPAMFTVVAGGTAPLNYQWRRGGAAISGATSSSYTLTPTVAADSGAQFDVVVSNGSGSVTSSVASLTVNLSPPSIQTQPANLSVIEPNGATFSVTAIGSAPLSYQWRRGGVPIGAATGASYTLTLTAQATDDGEQFDVIVTNPSGSVTSLVATLTVLTGLPADGLAMWLRADLGVVTNSPEVVQWTDQSGANHHATQNTLANQPVLMPNQVNGLPAVCFDGLNDFLTFNLPVNGLNGMTIIIVAANTQNQSAGASQAERSAIFWNESAGWGTVYLNPFQTTVPFRFGTTQAGNRIIYTRSSSVGSSFTLSTAVKNGATDSLYVNRVLATSQAGKLTQIAGCQATGNLGRGFNDDTYYAGCIAEVLVYTRALSDVERDAVEQYLDGKYHLTNLTPTPPQITQQPSGPTVVAPNAANFSVTAIGAAPLSYQWRRGGADISGATASTYSLSSTSVATDDGAQFDVIVSNASGSVTSTVATLTVVVAPVVPTGGLAVWLRGDAGTTLNLGAVSQWIDQSGNNRNAAQGVAGRQPLLTANAVNGLPALTFDGLDDFLTFNFPVNGLNGMTVFLVSANTQSQNGGGTQAEQATLFWNETAFWGTVYLSSYQSSVNFRFGTTQAGNRTIYTRSASVGSGFTLSSALKNGANEALYINGNLVNSQGGKLSPIAGCTDTGNLGRGYNDDSFFTGAIAEVLIYNQALGTTDRQTVEQYLLGKYGLAAGAGGGTAGANLLLQGELTSSGTLRVQIIGPTNASVVLERSSDLSTWDTVATATLSETGEATVELAAPLGTGFFRAKTP